MSKPSKHPLCILCKCLRILLGRSRKTSIYPVCITEYEHSLRLLDKKRLEVKMYNSIKIVSHSNHLINIVKSPKRIVTLQYYLPSLFFIQPMTICLWPMLCSTYQFIETLSCSKHSCWSNQIPLLYITCPVQWKARTHIALSQKNFYFLFFSQNIFMLHFKPYQKKDILLKV